MSEWVKTYLGELTELVTKGTTPSEKDGAFSDSGINYIKSDAVNYDGRIDASKFVYISKDIHEKFKRSQLKVDDVLFSMAGAFLGKTGIVKEDMLPANTNQAIAIIRLDKSKAQPRFINYFLRQDAVVDFVNNMSGQSAQPNINFQEIKSIEIDLPPLEEQKEISAVLSSLDDKIDLLHRQNQTLEAMAATLFRQWFVEEAQEDWEEVAVGDYVELNRASIDKNYTHKIIEYLDTGSLTEGQIEDLQLLTLDEAPSRAKRIVEHNDVLISTVRPDQNHYGIIKNPIDNLVVSTGFCVLTCTKIDPHFIYLLLTNDEMTDYLHTIAEGSTSTYPSLKPSDISAIVFQLPPDDRLKEFAVIAHNSWEKIEKNHIQIHTLEKLRDTLLPKLMSGEVRVVA
ncbi:MAG: restriction endonuclease subunit S [Sulfuriferula sp.]